MNFEITDICENIFDLNWKYGNVLGVYNSCFNIITDKKEIVTIFKNTNKFSTRAMITNLNKIPPVCDGMRAKNENGIIEIEKFWFNTNNAKIIKTKREPLTLSNDIHQNILIFEDVVKKYQNKSPLFNKGIIKNKADEGFKKLNVSLYDGFKSLIGLGIGLTPSCDDVISGICAYFYLCNIKSDFNKYLIDYLDKYGDDATTLVSKNLLCDVTKGYINSSLYNVIYAILNEKNNIEKYTLDLIDYGSSSGLETCMGILKGYKMTNNKELIKWL